MVLHSVAQKEQLPQVAHQNVIPPSVARMITKLHDDWTTWHKRFKDALDAHKSKTGDTDEDIAAAAETSRASITHWKVGRRTPQLRNFFLACQAVGADPAYVLFGKSFKAANDLSNRIASLPPEHIDAVMTALEGAEIRASKGRHAKAKAS